MKKIALVGYAVQEKYNHGVTNNEDADLLNFLRYKGLDVSHVIWNDENIKWENFEVVVIKSPWDYHEKISSFNSWLDKLSRLNIKMLNPESVIKWNSNKKYLKQVADKGLNVIQTAYLDKGSAFNPDYFDLFETEKIVVKPCISAGAKNTVIVQRSNFEENLKKLDSLLIENDYLIQPFIEEIKQGEWSYLFFNSKYSHCVLKTPKTGDFRVHHYLGGSLSYPDPNPVHVAQAEEYLKTMINQPLLYARVDGVISNNSFQLMELELIEPYLFLNADCNLLENYYKALVTQIS